MKDEKGLTFVSTAILVIIIALIAFAVVYFVRIQLDIKNAEDTKTDMLLVEAKVSKISGEYILNKKDEVLVGTKLSDMLEDEIIKDFLSKNLFDKDEKNKKYYVLNQDNLNELGLEKVVLDNSYYIVEYTEDKVYYTKGYLDENGETHYTVIKEESK